MNDIIFEKDINVHDMASFAVYMNKIYFSDINHNGLYSINIDTNEIKPESQFNNEPLLQETLYYNVYLYEKKLFFPPAFAKEAAVYDIERGSMIKIDISESVDGKIVEHPKFQSVCENDDSIIMVGDYLYGLLFINKKDLSIKYIDYGNRIELAAEEGKESAVIRSVAVIGNFLYMLCGKKNSIIVYNCAADTVSEIKINQLSEDEGLADIFFDEDQAWILTSKNNYLLKVNFRGTTIDLIKKYYNPYKKGENYDVGEIRIIKNKIYILPLVNNKIICFDIDTELFSVYRTIDKKTNNTGNKWGQIVPYSITYGSKLYYYDGLNMNILIDDGVSSEQEISLDLKDNISMLEMFINVL